MHCVIRVGPWTAIAVAGAAVVAACLMVLPFGSGQDMSSRIAAATAPSVPDETPLPDMTPLPYSTPDGEQAAGLPVRTGSEDHARALAFVEDGSGDVVYTVGRTYLSGATVFHLKADPSGVLTDTARALVALPEPVRSFRDVRAAPDGSLVVGATRHHDEAGARYAFADIFQIDDGEATTLTDNAYRINEIAVSPDSRSSALLLADGRLIVLEHTTGLTRTLSIGLLTPASVAAATIAWSPDATALFVGSHPDPFGARLERIDVQSGVRELVADLPGRHQAVPVVLPSGALRFVVHQAVPGVLDVPRFTARLMGWDGTEGGVVELAQLTPPEGVPDVVRTVAVHPDGDRLVYRLAGAVWSVPADGGAPATQRSAVDQWVTAGPVVTRTSSAGDRVAWIQRAQPDAGSNIAALFGVDTLPVWRVHAEPMP